MPFTTDEFDRRVRDSFPSVYLTLMSIIQGVALGIFVFKVADIINASAPEQSIYFRLLFPVLSFGGFIVVFYEYTWFIAVFRPHPDVWDTVIPFSLGLSEVMPLFFFSNQVAYWIATAIFCFVGMLGFANTIRLAGREFRKRSAIYILIVTSLRRNIVIAFTMVAICVASSWISWRWTPSSWFHFGPGVVLLACCVWILWADEILMETLRKRYIKRPGREAPLEPSLPV